MHLATMQQQLHASSTEGQWQYNIITELLKHTGDSRSRHIATQHLAYMYSEYITSIPNIKYKMC
jgi:subtilisin-like proprotein convertase family protein